MVGAWRCEWCCGVWGILRKFGGVGELLQESWDVTRHRQVDVVRRVVPSQPKAAELRVDPVGGGFVICIEGGEEVVSVFSVEILNTKIIDA